MAAAFSSCSHCLVARSRLSAERRICRVSNDDFLQAKEHPLRAGDRRARNPRTHHGSQRRCPRREHPREIGVGNSRRREASAGAGSTPGRLRSRCSRTQPQACIGKRSSPISSGSCHPNWPRGWQRSAARHPSAAGIPSLLPRRRVTAHVLGFTGLTITVRRASSSRSTASSSVSPVRAGSSGPARSHRRGRRIDPPAAGRWRRDALDRQQDPVSCVLGAARCGQEGTRRRPPARWCWMRALVKCLRSSIIRSSTQQSRAPDRRAASQPGADRHLRARLDNEALYRGNGAEKGKYRFNTVIDTSAGRMTIGNATISDSHKAWHAHRRRGDRNRLTSVLPRSLCPSRRKDVELL